MDLNPFLPVGIDVQTARFLDVFLLHCLLSDSPLDTPTEIAALARNQQLVATRGREPGLCLERGAQQVLLMDWAKELVQACAPIAEALDKALGGDGHQLAWQAAAEALDAPATLPSARVVAAMLQDPAQGHLGFAQAQSALNRATLMAADLPAHSLAGFTQQADESLQAQRALEAADTASFEDFRLDYMAAWHLVV